MMYIEINKPVPPRKKTALKRRIDNLNALLTLDEKREYVRTNNGWVLLKEWLSEFSHKKCWYCESKSLRAHGEVEHFRPKLLVTVNRSELVGHNGYYWLAYVWTNFRYTCQRCNKNEKYEDVLYGKHNEFPLVDEANRNFLPTDNNPEQPYLLDPCIKEDTELLAHLANGEVHPINTDKNSLEYKRAKYTLDTLGFNAYGVPKKKLKEWSTLNLLIEHTGLVEAPPVTNQVNLYLSKEHEYSSFFQSVIGMHKDKPWVAALL